MYCGRERFRKDAILVNGNIVNDFDTLDKSYHYFECILATQKLHKIKIKNKASKNEIHDLKNNIHKIQ